jgi:hypothetical protein
MIDARSNQTIGYGRLVRHLATFREPRLEGFGMGGREQQAEGPLLPPGNIFAGERFS